MNDPFLPEEVRAFVACELPGEWRQALADTSDALSRSLSKTGSASKTGSVPLRWVRPEGIHLTLKFLGDVGRHLLPDIQQAMAAATTGQRPVLLRLHGLGSFGGRGRVRVIWAGIEGDVQVLTALQRRLDGELSARGFAREVRPFSPHLTLARVPEGAPADSGARIATALRQITPPDVPPFSVREISLIRSQLSPRGATYTSLAVVSFAGGGAAV